MSQQMASWFRSVSHELPQGLAADFNQWVTDDFSEVGDIYDQAERHLVFSDKKHLLLPERQHDVVAWRVNPEGMLEVDWDCKKCGKRSLATQELTEAEKEKLNFVAHVYCSECEHEQTVEVM